MSDSRRTMRRAAGPGGRVLALAALLAAAGGCTLKTDVVANGGAAGNVSHLYLTVNEVWLGTGADTPAESGSGWNKHVLATPVTVDLATLTPGSLPALATGLTTAAGTYKQIHLVTADSGAALASSAQALGIAHNSEITLSDSSGTSTTAALESPIPSAGLTVATDLALAAAVTLGSSASSSAAAATSTGASTASTPSAATLAVTIDGARDVLPYSYGSSTGYLLSPVASASDEKNAGAISGSVDRSALATGAGPVSVSAEIADVTGTHHVIVQRRVVASDGSFTLYPLPAPRSGTTSYDLVIAGAGAATLIVRGIPVAAGSAQSAVSVQSAALALTPATSVYANLAPQAATLPGGARVTFYQTLPASGEIPYAIDGTAVDLISRRLPGDSFALGAGSLLVGDYASGGSISFATFTPLEGSGGYVVGSEGLHRSDTLALTPVVVSGTSAAPTPIAAPYPALAPGGIPGTLRVTLSAPAGVYDSGFVVVAAGNRVVDATSVGAILAAGGGTLTFTNLPSGSALAPTAGVPYQLAVRAWNSSVAASVTRAATTGSVAMGDAALGSATLQLP